MRTRQERTNRNVYILGAGFSAPAGVPVIRDFLDLSRELYDDPLSNLTEPERQTFGRVFEFKRRMALAREKFRIDLDDIEKLFGLVEMAERLDGINKQVRSDIVYLIAKTIELSATRPQKTRPSIGFGADPTPENIARLSQFPIGFHNHSGSRFSADLYRYFAALVAGHLDDPELRKHRKDTIITFNYDLICDNSLESVGVTPNYNLPDSFLFGGQQVSSNHRVDLLKLHGSTNWIICRRCRKVRVLDRKLTENPEAFRQMRCPICNQGSYQPLLVPPSWDKSEFRKVIQSVWTRAIEELRSATRICIIGYSVPETDAFFEYLLTLALAENDHLYRLIVVDLVSPESVAKRPELPELGQPDIKEKYCHMLDTMFFQKRFLFRGAGIHAFLGSDESKLLLGRAEAVVGSLKDEAL